MKQREAPLALMRLQRFRVTTATVEAMIIRVALFVELVRLLCRVELLLQEKKRIARRLEALSLAATPTTYEAPAFIGYTASPKLPRDEQESYQRALDLHVAVNRFKSLDSGPIVIRTSDERRELELMEFKAKLRAWRDRCRLKEEQWAEEHAKAVARIERRKQELKQLPITASNDDGEDDWRPLFLRPGYHTITEESKPVDRKWGDPVDIAASEVRPAWFDRLPRLIEELPDDLSSEPWFAATDEPKESRKVTDADLRRWHRKDMYAIR